MTDRKQEEFTPEEVAQCQAEFPGLSEKEARISLERRQVYGDPYQNHAGIAASWAGILQVWAERIARGDALPPHVVALLMAQLKINRCRLKRHQDNYDDCNVYMEFASAFQQRWEREGGESPKAMPQVGYIVGVDVAKSGSDITKSVLVGNPECPTCGKHDWIVPAEGDIYCKSCGKIASPRKFT